MAEAHECEDCKIVAELVNKIYGQTDTTNSVENTIVSLATVLAAAIASCSGSDEMLTLATETLRKVTDDMKDAEIWSQSIFPLVSHWELAELYAKCPTHLDAALKTQKQS